MAQKWDFPPILIFGPVFPLLRLGPISGPILFPILGGRPKTYFLAGRLGRKTGGKNNSVPSQHKFSTGRKLDSQELFEFSVKRCITGKTLAGNSPILSY